ncbi:MAG TPA: conjugal transfer protein TraI [Parafilimonas sp.]|nr:conjugal transfer protein TraI [Parafilimonas sp.]
MKKRVLMKGVVLTLLVVANSSQKANAQFIIAEVIKAGVKKVIMAVDLQVQRMQNKTIWLQNAQKEMENILSETKLTEISDWVEKQKDLYGDYFDELWKVKEVIEYYHRIEDIVDKQVKIVDEYESAFNLFKQDKHFTADELDYMGKVYSGILDQSLKNLDQLFLVINSFSTQMSDEKRLEIITGAGEAMDENYDDLKMFNNQNAMLSLQRSSDLNEADVVRQLYGIK